MGLPTEPVALTPEDISILNRKLADLRHSVNNHLTLISTALELMRRKPDSIPRMLQSLAEQPERIRDEMTQFSLEFAQILKITHD